MRCKQSKIAYATHQGAKLNYVAGIDPDVEKNGVALLDCEKRTIRVLASLPFPELLDFLRYIQRQAEVEQKRFRVIVEAGWLNKANWHSSETDTKQLAAAKGNAAGRNHETGRKIVEMCAHWQIPTELMKPLRLKVGGSHLWNGKDGKITHEELTSFTGITKPRTNQEERDAALLAWVFAGLPLKTARKQPVR